jgi:ERCC4-type nuclease
MVTSKTSSSTTTSSSSKAKAKCEANQEALDRLLVLKEKADANPNSHYRTTLSKACKSLADCKEPITTYKQAMELKFVGKKMARIICPLTDDTSTAAAPAPKSKASAGVKRKTTTAATAHADQGSTNALTQQTNSASLVSFLASQKEAAASSRPMPMTSSSQQAPSVKERTYETAKQQAIELNSKLPKTGPWKVVLLIDQREWKSEHVVAKCQQAGIPAEERHLPIGDMCWVARCGDIEILLGTVIERKEASDLASSLFGTRYMEQRLRLKNSGLPQILLLVEGNLNAVKNCPAATLEMCMMETRVELGFQIVKTPHLQDTIVTLKAMHRRIVQRTFPLRDLPDFGSPLGLPSAPRKRRRVTSLLEMVFDTEPTLALDMPRFMTFDELKAKIDFDREAGTKSSRAIYLAMLKQVATLSNKKCSAIADQYPTIDSLIRGYIHSSDPEKMVCNIPCDGQRVAYTSSVNLYKALCTMQDGTLLTGHESGGTTRSSESAAAIAVASTTSTREALPQQDKAASKPPPVSKSSPMCVDLTESTPVRKAPPYASAVNSTSGAWGASPPEANINSHKLASPLSDCKPSPKKTADDATTVSKVSTKSAAVPKKTTGHSTTLEGLYSDDSSPLFTPAAKNKAAYASTALDDSISSSGDSARKAKADLLAQAALRRLGLSSPSDSSSCLNTPELPSKRKESVSNVARLPPTSHGLSQSDASSSVWNSPVLSQDTTASSASVVSTSGQKTTKSKTSKSAPKPKRSAAPVFSIDDSSDEEDSDEEFQKAIAASKALSNAQTVSVDDVQDETSSRPPKKARVPPSDVEVIEID